MENKDVIGTLNDLIETSKDGEIGFRTCAETVKSTNLEQLFEVAAERCAQGASELQSKVRLAAASRRAAVQCRRQCIGDGSISNPR